MHHVIYKRHEDLNLFETNLSVPAKDLYGTDENSPSRGFPILQHIDDGYAVPMFKLAGELHYLLTMKSIFRNDNKVGYLEPEALSNSDRVEAMLENAQILGADHALDIHPLLDSINGESYVQSVNVSINILADQLLRAQNKPFDYESLLIYTNSGVGKTTKLGFGEDGIIRDDDGFSNAIRLKSNLSFQYQRGLPGAYQNTGKTHIQFVPVPSNIEDVLVPHFIGALRKIHEVREEATLQGYRNKMQRIGNPDVGVISVAHVRDVTNNIVFEHFSDWSLEDSARDSLTMSSLAGGILRNKYSELSGVDLNDKEVVKALRRVNIEFYKSNIT
jgi:hypothetical protein